METEALAEIMTAPPTLPRTGDVVLAAAPQEEEDLRTQEAEVMVKIQAMATLVVQATFVPWTRMVYLSPGRRRG
jgi:hypothetical protein